MADIANPIKTRMTWDEFLAAGEEWQRWELVDGEVEFKPSPAGAKRGVLLAHLCAQLKDCSAGGLSWVALAGDPTFTMDSGNWRCPDAALVRAERYPGRKIPDGPTEFPPDIAFEVLSPGDTARRIARKRRDYQESGVIQVWIDTDKRAAEVVYPDRASQYFDEERPLTIDGVDGFALDLRVLFEV